MVDIFGWEFKRKNDEEGFRNSEPSVVNPLNDDGALDISATGGLVSTVISVDPHMTNETELINKYRDISIQPEIDVAVDDIINEAMVTDEGTVVELNLDETKLSDSIKKKIIEEFNSIKSLMEFDSSAYEIFKKYYVDGRLRYQVLIDKENSKDGIQELRYIDPRKIRKVREVAKESDKKNGVTLTKIVDEYYLYSPNGFSEAKADTGLISDYENIDTIKLTNDSVVEVLSGIMDKSNSTVLSYLHKAIKPLNQLRILEDAAVIYRLARAPEKRIFYIDTGQLPKAKAEAYVRDMMTKHKNKIKYNAETGMLTSSKNVMSMLDDYWMPRREGGRSTQVETLPSGSQLGEMDDINYFLEKLYRSLNVPYSRLDPQSGFTLGRTTEITRDEIKFSKFIGRLRKRFSTIFLELLKRQLMLKNIMNEEDFNEIRNLIQFDYAVDTYFSEMKDSEILGSRVELLDRVRDYRGTFFSKNYIFKKILRFSDDDIKDVKAEMEEDAKEEPKEDENSGGFGRGF